MKKGCSIKTITADIQGERIWGVKRRGRVLGRGGLQDGRWVGNKRDWGGKEGMEEPSVRKVAFSHGPFASL